MDRRRGTARRRAPAHVRSDVVETWHRVPCERVLRRNVGRGRVGALRCADRFRTTVLGLGGRACDPFTTLLCCRKMQVRSSWALRLGRRQIDQIKQVMLRLRGPTRSNLHFPTAQHGTKRVTSPTPQA